MSANIKVSGKVYNGIETISVKDTSDAQVNFLLQGATPPPAPAYKENDVTFIDYNGSIVISYSKTAFLALTAMPANPSHTGLVAEGWNWTLSDAKTYVASYGKLNIGQMYHTASGKTEYDIEVNEASGMTATLTGTSGTDKDWGDGTTDALETHTYASAGNYTIKLSGTTLPIVSNSKKVRAVRIANGVTSIGASAFQNCYSLQSVTIPPSVTTIEDSAFYQCYSLLSVTIPDSVTSIIDAAFKSCYLLQSVTIPSSVTNINSSSFANCYSLQSITIPSSVTSIGASALTSCYSLQSVTIPSSVTSIEQNMLSYCYLLKSVTIANGVTSIGASAFQNCYSLQSVTIPPSVTHLYRSSFTSCRSLQSVTIPSSVTNIVSSSFSSCSWLTIVTVLATTPPTLGTSVFPSNVTTIYIPNGTLATYQATTNWSTYSSKFVELPA